MTPNISATQTLKTHYSQAISASLSCTYFLGELINNLDTKTSQELSAIQKSYSKKYPVIITMDSHEDVALDLKIEGIQQVLENKLALLDSIKESSIWNVIQPSIVKFNEVFQQIETAIAILKAENISILISYYYTEEPNIHSEESKTRAEEYYRLYD